MLIGVCIMFRQTLYRRFHKDKQANEAYRCPFLDLHLSISNGFVSSKLYDKRDDFDFEL